MLSRGSLGFYFTLFLFSTTTYNLCRVTVLFQVSDIFEAIRNLTPKSFSIAMKLYFTKGGILSASFFYRKQREFQILKKV